MDEDKQVAVKTKGKINVKKQKQSTKCRRKKIG